MSTGFQHQFDRRVERYSTTHRNIDRANRICGPHFGPDNAHGIRDPAHRPALRGSLRRLPVKWILGDGDHRAGQQRRHMNTESHSLRVHEPVSVAHHDIPVPHKPTHHLCRHPRLAGPQVPEPIRYRGSPPQPITQHNSPIFAIPSHGSGHSDLLVIAISDIDTDHTQNGIQVDLGNFMCGNAHVPLGPRSPPHHQIVSQIHCIVRDAHRCSPPFLISHPMLPW